MARRSCLIAALPRSGSWMLSDALARTGVAGIPEEYFRDDHTVLWSERWGLAGHTRYDRYIKAALVAGTTPNGVFSVKLHWYQFDWLLVQLRGLRAGSDAEPAALSRSALIEATFPEPRYVRIVRHDSARQAVSYYRAATTDTWFVAEDEANDAAPDPDPDVVDLQSVQWLEDSLHAHGRRWDEFFESSGITPLTVVYEEMAADYERTVRRVLEFLGLELGSDAALDRPGVKRQADGWNERVLERYLEVRGSFPPQPKNTHWSDRDGRFVTSAAVARS